MIPKSPLKSDRSRTGAVALGIKSDFFWVLLNHIFGLLVVSTHSMLDVRDFGYHPHISLKDLLILNNLLLRIRNNFFSKRIFVSFGRIAPGLVLLHSVRIQV